MIIKDQVFVITGGASGLGEATARHLAALGGKVCLFDIDLSRAEALAASLGGQACAVNVTDSAQIAAGLDRAEAMGPIRGVINCAGIGTAKRVVGRDGPIPMEEFDRTLAVNLSGTFNVLRLAAARMQHNSPQEDGERGLIVMTASLAAYDGQIGQAAYAASKGGITAMTLPIAREFARLGLRVMTIAPGIFLTPIMGDTSPEAQAAIGKDIQFPARLGRPQEYAQLVEAIVTNRYLNGEVIRLDAATRLSPR